MSLRLILIIIGVLIVAAILIDGFRHWRRAKKHQNELDNRAARTVANMEPHFDKRIDFIDDLEFTPVIKPEEPKFDDTLLMATEELLPTPKPAPRPVTGTTSSAPVTMPAPLPKKDKFIILHVLAEPDTYFSGEALAAKFAAQGLHFGSMEIFHQYENEVGTGNVLFSVANAFEPGTLNLDPKGFYTQGLTLFIQLPSKSDAQLAFEAMLNTATLLAKSFNARLCDHHRKPLTPAMVEEYRNEVTACNVI